MRLRDDRCTGDEGCATASPTTACACHSSLLSAHHQHRGYLWHVVSRNCRPLVSVSMQQLSHTLRIYVQCCHTRQNAKLGTRHLATYGIGCGLSDYVPAGLSQKNDTTQRLHVTCAHTDG